MPLFPRPWPSPLTSEGDAHSTCNWQSPNSRFVEMLPVPFTVNTPSLICHFAGPPSFELFHWAKSVPSKRMIASDGGGPGSIPFGSVFVAELSFWSAAKQVTANKKIVRESKTRMVVFMLVMPTG